jgi:glycosyltransferase involved in cell wall biosynthesis
MTTAKSVVSIGLPVRNGEEYLGATLDSILGQTLGDFELIISDNASDDATADICRDYERRDPRISYYRQETNIGCAGNFNFVADRARAPYFKWACHDDLLAPDYIEACVSVLEASPHSVLCQSFVCYIDGQGRELGVYDSGLGRAGSEDPAGRFALLVLSPHAAADVMGVFRRSAMGDRLLMTGFHGDDKALLAEAALRGGFLQVSQPLLLVRDHEKRYSRSMFRPSQRMAWSDPKAESRLSFPTWRLYGEYVRMIPRNVENRSARLRCYASLFLWFGVNWNAARMLVDLIAVGYPDVVEIAERFKQRYLSPAPGAQQVTRRNLPEAGGE